MPDPAPAFGFLALAILGYEIQDELLDDDREDSLVESVRLLVDVFIVIAGLLVLRFVGVVP